VNHELLASLLLGILLGGFLMLGVITWMRQHAEKLGENETDWITVDLERDGGTDGDTQPSGPMPLR
jgi:hypothetical protein